MTVGEGGSGRSYTHICSILFVRWGWLNEPVVKERSIVPAIAMKIN